MIVLDASVVLELILRTAQSEKVAARLAEALDAPLLTVDERLWAVPGVRAVVEVV